MKFLKDFEQTFVPKLRRDITDLVRNIHYEEQLSLKVCDAYELYSLFCFF